MMVSLVSMGLIESWALAHDWVGGLVLVQLSARPRPQLPDQNQDEDYITPVLSLHSGSQFVLESRTGGSTCWVTDVHWFLNADLSIKIIIMIIRLPVYGHALPSHPISNCFVYVFKHSFYFETIVLFLFTTLLMSVRIDNKYHLLISWLLGSVPNLAPSFSSHRSVSIIYVMHDVMIKKNDNLQLSTTNNRKQTKEQTNTWSDLLSIFDCWSDADLLSGFTSCATPSSSRSARNSRNTCSGQSFHNKSIHFHFIFLKAETNQKLQRPLKKNFVSFFNWYVELNVSRLQQETNEGLKHKHQHLLRS